MKNFATISLIIATAMLVCGIILCLVAYLVGDMGKFIIDNRDYEVATATFDQADTIEIDVASADVKLVPATADEITVYYPQFEKVGYSVVCEDGTLKVKYEDQRKWYEHIGMFLYPEGMNITVELPQKIYDAVTVDTASGDINISENLSFKTCALDSASGDVKAYVDTHELSVHTTSGYIDLKGEVSSNCSVNSTSGSINITGSYKGLKLSATSGDVLLSSMSAGDVSVSVTSGEITMNSAESDSMSVHSLSGDISLADVLVSGNINMETTSGDISLSSVDAENYTVKTTSGDVTGTIINNKMFHVNTTSGDYATPHTDYAKGTFTANTTSGDVTIELSE